MSENTLIGRTLEFTSIPSSDYSLSNSFWLLSKWGFMHYLLSKWMILLNKYIKIY